MTSPRNLIIAGVVLVAIALASSGHGVWWLFGLLWVLPHVAGEGRCRGSGRRRGAREHDQQTDGGSPSVSTPAPAPAPSPDPTSDRHVAFPPPPADR